MVSYNKPLSSTSSSLSSSRWFPILPALQLPPTSSLPAFLAAIFNADRATNQRHSSPRLWLFIPSKSCLPFLPSLLPFADCNQRHLAFFTSYGGVKRGAELLCLAECQKKKISMVGSPSLLSHLSHCVCVCMFLLKED